MFNYGNRIIKMMQQFFPFFEPFTFPEARGMIFYCIPPDSQQIFIVIFQALLQLVLNITPGRLNDWLRLNKRFLECCCFSFPDR